MPKDTALALLKAKKTRDARNPGEPQSTIFKFLLWERFEGRLVREDELDRLARESANLCELTLGVVSLEKPQIAGDDRLRQAARREVEAFFAHHAPEEMR